MKETVISWTFPNWITVFLMAALGSIVAGTVIKFFVKSRKGNSGD